MASIIKVTEILHPTSNVPSLTINSDSTVSFDAGILSVTGPINGVIGANTPYSGTFTNLSYSGTLTGNTGIINIGSGQIYKDANGQIGIGTSSPGYRLDVAAGDTTANFGYALRLRSNATANAATLQFTNSGVSAENGYIRVTDTGLMSFSNKAYITSAGNVGIDTSSPTEKLDVSGNVKVSGSLSVAGNNYSPQTGFKNRIINGDFSVWQRGTARYSNSGMGSSAKYYADRWTSGQYQNAAFERVDRTTAGPTSKYAMRVSSSSAAEDGSGTRMVLGQLIEHLNCADLAEQSVTLSFWVRFSASSIASYGSFNYSVWQQDSVDLAFDTNGATRADTLSLTNGSFPTTWTKLTLVVTTASTMKNLAVQFGFSNLANTASNGSFWYEIAEVQIEKNSVATPFEFRSIGQELALCQRYFQKWDYSAALGSSGATALVANKYSTTDSLVATASLNMPMRTSPTISSTNATARAVLNTGGGITVNIAAMSAGAAGAGLNVGGTITIVCNNNSLSAGFGWLDAIGVLSASAEL
jgi:hypothetical protein